MRLKYEKFIYIFQYLMGMKSAPLSKVASLNLTGSLSNVDYPMDLIKFSTMFELVRSKIALFKNEIMWVK